MGCEYLGGTQSSCFVSAADDVLEMCGMSGVGGVYEICMCLAPGRSKSIGFGPYQSCRNRVNVGGVSVFGLRRCGWCWRGEWVGLGMWGGVMYVCVVSLDYLWRWQVQISVYCARRIPAHLRRTQCSIGCTLSISAS